MTVICGPSRQLDESHRESVDTGDEPEKPPATYGGTSAERQALRDGP
jgi:hypothetical protein